LVSSTNCKYSANTEVARKSAPSEELLRIRQNELLEEFSNSSPEEIATPGSGSIDEVAELLGLSEKKNQLLKSYVLKDLNNNIVLLVVKGDRQIKIPDGLKPFEKIDFEENPEIINGFLSPFGLNLPDKPKVICDFDVLNVPPGGYVVGANKVGYHFGHVVPIKDFKVDAFADVAVVVENDGCPNCGSKLEIVRSVEAAHTFQIGLKYTSAMANAEFLDEDGVNKPYYMGCYGIGVSRLISVIAIMTTAD
jgi:prolyl-tRNA synthetase